MNLIQHPHWLGDKNVDFDYLYLPLALKSATISNPNLEVVYINANDSRLNIKGVVELPLVSVEEDLAMLADNYIHLSSNQYLFELHSIQRHFVLRNTMRKLSLDSTYVSEGDVLLLRSFESVLGDIHASDVSALLTEKTCVSTGWVTLEYIEYYCDMVLKIYTTPGLKKGISNIYDDMKNKNQNGGICDMTFCHFINIQAYGFNNQLIVDDICKVRELNSQRVIFDNFLPWLDVGGVKFKSAMCNFNQQLVKKLSIVDGLVFAEGIDGQKVQMSSLHFQGQSKRLMSFYFTNTLC